MSSTTYTSQLVERENVMKSIREKSFSLKHVKIVCDKSAPIIDASWKQRDYGRRLVTQALLQPVNLRHIDSSKIYDRSAPRIPTDVIFRFEGRKAYLDSVLEGAHNFYSKMWGAVSASASLLQSTAEGIAHTGYVVANQTQLGLHEAAHKASEVISASKDLAQATAAGAIKTGVAIASTAQAKASAAVDTGKAIAVDAVATGKAIAQNKTAEVLETGKAIASQAQSKAATAYNSTLDAAHEAVTHEKVNARREYEREKWTLETRSALLNDIKENRAQLEHVRWRNIHDRSKPFLPSTFALQTTKANSVLQRQEGLKRTLNFDIQRKASLKSLNHVVTAKDASKPCLPEKVNLQKSDRKKLMAEIAHADAKLHSTDIICDRSAPMLPEGKVTLGKPSSRKALLDEVKTGVELEKNSLVKDRSAPHLPAM